MRYVLVIFLWHLADADRLSDEDWRTREAAQERIERAGVLAVPTLMWQPGADPEARRRLDSIRDHYRPARDPAVTVLACWIVADRDQRPDKSSLDWAVLRDMGVGEELIRLGRAAGVLNETEAESWRAIIFDRAAGISTLADLIEVRTRGKE